MSDAEDKPNGEAKLLDEPEDGGRRRSARAKAPAPVSAPAKKDPKAAKAAGGPKKGA